ncbi:hypothetical protein Mapa_008647 [Marchantia paleacea]|nr:hypothetical protein Mapa_008647 [Marchantia paleacea]
MEDTGEARHAGRFTARTRCLLLVAIWLQVVPAVAQPGYISLACGTVQRTNVADSSGLVWMPDDRYVQSGEKFQVSAGSDLSLRSFSRGAKNCYTFDEVQLGRRYLIRGTFLYANYDGLSRPPKFDVAVDATAVFEVQFGNKSSSIDPEVHEVIIKATRNPLSYCLLSTPESGFPVISKLELRLLPTRSYEAVNSTALKLLSRIDSGSVSLSRYPSDGLDRIWSGEAQPVPNFTTADNVTTHEKQLIGTESVLKTARVADVLTRRLEYTLTSPNTLYPYHLYLYFAEINPTVNRGDKVFDIYANGVSLVKNVDILTIASPLTGFVLGFQIDKNYSTSLNISLLPSTNSRELPSLNGIEIFQVIQVHNGTRQEDVQALLSVKDELNLILSDWSGDPCLPLWRTQHHSEDYTSWAGLSCQSTSYMTTITGLNLSNKSLRGSIPTNINKLISLEYLNLANNSFSGQIPDLSFLTNLTTLDLRNNQLSGEIPSYLLELPRLNILASGNPLLSTSSFKESAGKPSSDRSLKIIIGAFVGATILVCLITMAVITYCYRKRQAKLDIVASAFNLAKADGPTYTMTALPYPSDIELQIRDVKVLTLKEVEVTTGNFASRIGEGGFGAVYFGNLADGSAVAVKVRSLTSNQGDREFQTEINLLSHVRHDNLVPLLGYCSENQQQILIYPYMSNGSLHDRLYGDGATRKPLDWQTRLNIVLGAARGISFLHTGGSRCIIHRDVKSSNILLDDSMRAKIADFGLSKYSPMDGDSLVSTEVRGTAGYLDPEYYSTQQLTEKSDVFSFGIVLLEVICGREPLNVKRPRSEWSLLEWVRPYIREGNIQPVIDPAIAASYTTESLWRVIETALQSVEPQSSRRPTMADVVRELEDALIIESNASQYMASIQSLDTLCISASDIKPPSAFPLTFPFEPSPVFSDKVFSDSIDPPGPR